MASREVRKKEFDDALRSLQITTKIITKHKLDRVRRILNGEIQNDPKLKFWVKKRNFRVIDLPKLGLKKVVVVPSLVPSESGYTPERTIFGLFKKVVPLEELFTVLESVHSNSIRHFGHKTTLYEAQRHYYGITRSAVDKFISMCPICCGKGDELDGLLGPKKRSMYEKKNFVGDQANYKRFKVGDVVLLNIPEVFRKGYPTVETLPGIVIAARRRSKVLYQLCCEHGIVNCWFSEDQLEPYGGIVTMDITREITIYKAVKILHMIKTLNCNCENKANCLCAKNVADSICSPQRHEPFKVMNFGNGTAVRMIKFSETDLEQRYNQGLCAAEFCQEPREDVTIECSKCNGRYHTMCLSTQPAVYETSCYCGCNNQDRTNIKVNLNHLQQAEEHLKRIIKGETSSWRLKWWWRDEATAKELKKYSHISCLEAGSHDQIMNYYLTKEFVKVAVQSSVLRVAFILDVLLPEAVIYNIQKQTVSRCFAEKIYSKYLPCFQASE